MPIEIAVVKVRVQIFPKGWIQPVTQEAEITVGPEEDPILVAANAAARIARRAYDFAEVKR